MAAKLSAVDVEVASRPPRAGGPPTPDKPAWHNHTNSHAFTRVPQLMRKVMSLTQHDRFRWHGQWLPAANQLGGPHNFSASRTWGAYYDERLRVAEATDLRSELGGRTRDQLLKSSLSAPEQPKVAAYLRDFGRLIRRGTAHQHRQVVAADAPAREDTTPDTPPGGPPPIGGGPPGGVSGYITREEDEDARLFRDQRLRAACQFTLDRLFGHKWAGWSKIASKTHPEAYIWLFCKRTFEHFLGVEGFRNFLPNGLNGGDPGSVFRAAFFDGPLKKAAARKAGPLGESGESSSATQLSPIRSHVHISFSLGRAQTKGRIRILFKKMRALRDGWLRQFQELTDEDLLSLLATPAHNFVLLRLQLYVVVPFYLAEHFLYSYGRDQGSHAEMQRLDEETFGATGAVRAAATEHTETTSKSAEASTGTAYGN